MENNFKYDIGDEVQIVLYNEIERPSASPTFVSDMRKYCGTRTMVQRRFMHNGERCYRLTGNAFAWREDWLDVSVKIDIESFSDFLMT